MHLDWFLTSRTPLWGGIHRRLPVTDAHLQQKKYEVNNPKVSSPEMWLASKLDSGTMTEATAWLLRILWVLLYSGMRSADQNCIPDGLMRRMKMYRDEVERFSVWETSRMRMATETTTKGGRVRLVQQQRRRRKNMWRGRTRRCWQQPRQPTTNTSFPPDGFELGTNVGKNLGFFDGEVLGTTLGVAYGITLGIDEVTTLGSPDGSSDGSNEGKPEGSLLGSWLG